MSQLISKTGVSFGTSGARGLVSNMNDDLCYAYTQAFLSLITRDHLTSVVIGHDLRPSSLGIASACAAAVKDFGLNVIYAGALPTPALAYYGRVLKTPVVVVTGSHIPFDRNGIKFYRAEGEISKSDESAIQNAWVNLPSKIELPDLSVPDDMPKASYLRRYVDFFSGQPLLGIRVAIYEHSSVGRNILREIFESLGAKVLSLGRTETFVPIDTEAVRPEDAEQAMRWAHEYSFDAILSTDGDADRPLIGDEMGRWFRGDAVGTLTAKYLQSDVVVTPVSSNTAVEQSGWFGSVVRTRIGSPYVIEGMQLSKCNYPNAVIVGYEANGGFLLGADLVRDERKLDALPTRDAVLPMISLLLLAREKGVPLSALNEELPERYTASDRLQNVPHLKSTKLLDALAHDPVFAGKILANKSGLITALDQTDGLRCVFENGDIVHLRASGNAPELRCYAESGAPQGAKSLCDEAIGAVRPYVKT